MSDLVDGFHHQLMNGISAYYADIDLVKNSTNNLNLMNVRDVVRH